MLTLQLTYNDAHGQTGLRVFPKCSDSTCTVFDQPTKLRISSGRWYPSLTRLSDGSIFVTSGTIDGTFVGGENSSLVNYSHECVEGGRARLMTQVLPGQVDQ